MPDAIVSNKPTISPQTLPPKPIAPPAELKDHQPTMPEVKHPCRVAIVGHMDGIANLRKAIAARSDLSDSIKAMVDEEIAARTSNAAQVHLHVVDHPNGDTSIHFHVKKVKLG